ncbi:hypothetical protein PLICRDRAFT_159913 [Plicaturopsis crispa FD-325 SS-3]|nr:hypothetical protein PLICRDRAFT_159913 [Plicaturopsis crispa FD-325 SS-3]
MSAPQQERVAIFWDFENCRAVSNLSGHTLVDNIRRTAHEYGSVNMFKAYLELAENDSPRSSALRSELQCSGVSLTDTPHNGRKDVADKMMIVDMLAYAIDNPAPSTIMIISGDRDFAYAIATLRLRRYRVVLITPPPPIHVSLTAQATVCYDWYRDILGKAEPDPVSGLSKPLDDAPLDDLPSGYDRNSPPIPDSSSTTPYLTYPSESLVSLISASRLSTKGLGKRSGDDPRVRSWFSDLRTSGSFDNGDISSGRDRDRMKLPTSASRSSSDYRSSSGRASPAPGRSSKSARLPSQSKINLSSLRDEISPPEPQPQATTESQTTVESQATTTVPPAVIVPPATIAPLPEPESQPEQPTEDSCDRVVATDLPEILPVTPECATEIAVESQLAPASLPTQVGRQLNPAATPYSPIVPPVIKPAYSRPATPPARLPSYHAFDFFCSPRVTRTEPPLSRSSSPLLGLEHRQHHPWMDQLPPLVPPQIPQVSHEPELALDNHPEAPVPMTSTSPTLTSHVPISNDPIPAIHETMETTTTTSTSEPISSIIPIDASPSSSSADTIPPMFRLLADSLDRLRLKNTPRPFQSVVAMHILMQDNNVYRRAGAQTIAEYIAMAENAGVVEVGGEDPKSWVSLKPEWHGCGASPAEDATADSAVQPSSATPTPIEMSSSTTLGPVSPLPPPPMPLDVSQTPAPSSTTTPDIHGPTPDPPSSTVCGRDLGLDTPTRQPIPPVFEILVKLLQSSQKRGVTRPRCSHIARHIARRHRTTYESAGVTKWDEYAKLAEKAGVVIMGGDGEDAWISLPPSSGKSTRASSALSRRSGAGASLRSSSSLNRPSARSSRTIGSVNTEPAFASTPRPFSEVLLELLRSPQGRDVVSAELPERHKVAYESRWKEYAELAAKAGIKVVIGNKINGAHNSSTSSPDTLSSPNPLPSAGKPVPPAFKSLVEVLQAFRAKNVTRPACSIVVRQLLQRDKLAYKAAGVTQWKHYAERAEKAGVVVIGGTEPTPWISLHSDYHCR